MGSHNHGTMNMDANMTTTTMAMMMHNDTMDDNHHHHHHGNMSMGTTTDPHAGHGGDGEHGGGMDHSMAGHTMQMYFHTGLTEYILFKDLHTSDVGGLVGACVAIFVLAVAYEGLKFFREFLLRKTSRSERVETYTPSTAVNGGVVAKQPEVGARMLSWAHGFQTLLHMIQVFVSYCLMLVFMTYNVYLCVAIILGAGVGYFFFGWRRAMVVDMNEHCH